MRASSPPPLNTVSAGAQCGGDVHVLVAGHNAAAAAQAAAQISGVAKVLHADAPGLAHGLAENVAAQVLAIARTTATSCFPRLPAARTSRRALPPSLTSRRSATSPACSRPTRSSARSTRATRSRPCRAWTPRASSPCAPRALTPPPPPGAARQWRRQLPRTTPAKAALSAARSLRATGPSSRPRASSSRAGGRSAARRSSTR